MDQQNQNLFELQLDQTSTAYLGEAAKWAKFLAILGFIFCAFLVIAALFAGTMMSAMMSAAGGGMGSMFGSGFITILYLMGAALYFFPCLFLFRFASQMQDAIRNHEQAKLQGSLKNLKSLFRFLGILTIIIIAFYILIFIGILVVGVGTFMQ
jgi:uncharacterized membrane protein YjgN (DUF898 family)